MHLHMLLTHMLQTEAAWCATALFHKQISLLTSTHLTNTIVVTIPKMVQKAKSDRKITFV